MKAVSITSGVLALRLKERRQKAQREAAEAVLAVSKPARVQARRGRKRFIKKVEHRDPSGDLHVILDNSSTDGTPDVQAWLGRSLISSIHFLYAPASAPWGEPGRKILGILEEAVPERERLPLQAHWTIIAAYMPDGNRNPIAFEWTKRASAIVRSHRRMRDGISRACASSCVRSRP